MMSNEFLFRLLLGVAVVLLTDALLYFGLRRLFVKKGLNGNSGKRFTWIYLSITIAFALYAGLHYLYLHFYGQGPGAYRQYFFITGALILLYAPKVIMLVFILTGNILIFLLQLISYISLGRGHYDFVRRLRRIKFLSWLGFIAGLFVFGCVLYGMLYTRTDYRVKEVSVSFRNLPSSFDGTRLLLIADLHAGSFFNERELFPAMLKIKELNPDMILFAGDMINVSAKEIQPYMAWISELKAPLGKYSVLGNHDMDDYMKLTITEGKEIIEKEMVRAEEEMGFTVLRNEHLFVHKGADSIALIGVDSWGKGHFHQYGKLPQAMDNLPAKGFKLLLSHNPEHWEAEVKGKTNIDLTLSGHTHAAQVGIDEPWLQWSPFLLKHSLCMGWYRWGNQYLYVNTGLGYLGFPGRIGIHPEITVITLKRE